jgi:hypothetical protein
LGGYFKGASAKAVDRAVAPHYAAVEKVRAAVGLGHSSQASFIFARFESILAVLGVIYLGDKNHRCIVH